MIYSYVEIWFKKKTIKTVTRIPMDDWEEAKRAVSLLANELFPENNCAIYACANGVYEYKNTNDFGDEITIKPMLSKEALEIGENMSVTAENEE